MDLPEYKPKGDRYEKLAEKNVPNIPQCLVWGHILDDKYHATRIQAFVSTSWVISDGDTFLPHRHYRLVLDVIGSKLTSFCSSYKAVKGVQDALISKTSLLVNCN